MSERLIIIKRSVQASVWLVTAHTLGLCSIHSTNNMAAPSRGACDEHSPPHGHVSGVLT